MAGRPRPILRAINPGPTVTERVADGALAMRGAARFIGCSRSMLQRLILEGLPSFRMGGKRLVLKNDLRAYLATLVESQRAMT